MARRKPVGPGKEHTLKLPPKAGECKVCEINLYPNPRTKAIEPRIWPCGVEGCPYETKEEQEQINFEMNKRFPIAGPGGE